MVDGIEDGPIDNSPIDKGVPDRPRKGRGAVSNRSGRFEALANETVDDGWGTVDEELPPLRTTLTVDTARSVIARNNSPDVPFEQSINPYRGCEHGCVYCYARPSHAFLGLSPGLDFETRLFYKPEAAALLEAELRHPRYKPKLIALGTNTDPYQPVERELGLTRSILEVLARFNHPVGIVTKSALVLRDLDILGPMAKKGLAQVFLSVTTLDRALARQLEPRAATPPRRLEAIAQLTAAGVPTGAMAAPMIPALNDHELEAILAAVAERGASSASYILLRLPLEIKELFAEWLKTHAPDRAERILSLIRQTRDGGLYTAEFGKRMRGTGAVADLLAARFRTATRRLGLNRGRSELNVSLFRVPPAKGHQLQLL